MDGNLTNRIALDETGASEPAPPGVGSLARLGNFRMPLPWKHVRRVASGSHTLAMIDQAVVSATSFLTTILIGRWCGADELGVYGIAFSLLLTCACVQDSLIAMPYTIFWRRPRIGTAAEFAGSALVHNGWLSAVAMMALALTGAAMWFCGAAGGLVAATWTLVAIVPLSLLREFGRRFAFAHLQMGQALALDLGVAAIQLTGLGGLALAGRLSATTAYVAIGVACAAAGSVWLNLAWNSFAIRWDQARQTVRQNWGLGKWLFASQVSISIQACVGYWALALIYGTEATGQFVACMTIVQFSNPFILGIGNLLAPKAAQAFTQSGSAALRLTVFQCTWLLVGVMALFCLFVLVAGDAVIHLLYHGPQYDGRLGTILLLALGASVAAAGTPPSCGLTAIERPDVTFRASFFGALAALILVPLLASRWGLTGAAWGFLISHVASTSARWIGFTVLVRRHREATCAGVKTPCIGSVASDQTAEAAAQGNVGAGPAMMVMADGTHAP